MEWSAFNKFADATEGLLPPTGEGETMANQVVTAVSKIVYKWFNDGDVFDTTSMPMGCNDLSSYANWLYKHAHGCEKVLSDVDLCFNDEDYEKLLYKLCELTMNMEYLKPLMDKAKIDSVYTCDGIFECHEDDWYDEDDDGWEDDDDDDDYWGD